MSLKKLTIIMIKSSLLFFFSLFFSIIGFSQEESNKKEEQTKPVQRNYTTKHIGSNEAPKIDAVFDEAAWDSVEWASDFVENQPDNGTPPSEQTKFKVLYDDKNIYFAFVSFDAEPDKIVRRLSRRDGFEGDFVEINIDSYHDKRTAFSFTITAAGVKGDEFISNNGHDWDPSWNPIWYVKTQITEEGWIAELRIPLSQLRFSSEQEQVWGLQVMRRYFRKEERSTWQHILANSPGWVSEFGQLNG